MQDSLKKDDFMIIVGASAGGVKAVCKLLSQLDTSINAAIGVVIHLPQYSNGDWLLPRLQEMSALPCQVAEDHLPLKRGRVYIAPANYHMIIKKEEILLGKGPMEGRWRPSIDVSLRSAAASWDTHSVGIILTGLLNDGVSGLGSIRKSGGLSIVQDPEEAEYPDMPLAALRNSGADYCIALGQMGAILNDYLSKIISRSPAPEIVLREASISEQVSTDIDGLKKIAQHTLYSCPDCGGGLWEVRNGNVCHYRCHIGHSYTEKGLMQEQQRSIEKTLWVAVRMMEERHHLLSSLADKEKERGHTSMARNHAERVAEIETHIARLKDLLFICEKRDPD